MISGHHREVKLVEEVSVGVEFEEVLKDPEEDDMGKMWLQRPGKQYQLLANCSE